MSSSYFENANDTNASHGNFSAVGGNQYNNNEHRGTISRRDQFRGRVDSEVIGGSGHQNTFYNDSIGTPDSDELRTIKIELTRINAENQQLANKLVAAKNELEDARRELDAARVESGGL